jgi:hypothetical protein
MPFSVPKSPGPAVAFAAGVIDDLLLPPLPLLPEREQPTAPTVAIATTAATHEALINRRSITIASVR